jgi:hypothetical protein
MATTEPKTADLVSAANAAAAANLAGGGDLTVWNAGIADIDFRCEADCEMLRDEREFLLRKAKTYDATKRPGYADGARKQAAEKNDEIKARRETASAAKALFAIKGGFTSLVPQDEMRAAASSALRKTMRPVADLLRNLVKSGKVETADLGDGVIINLASTLAWYDANGFAPIVEPVAATETVAEPIVTDDAPTVTEDAPVLETV